MDARVVKYVHCTSCDLLHKTAELCIFFEARSALHTMNLVSSEAYFKLSTTHLTTEPSNRFKIQNPLTYW